MKSKCILPASLVMMFAFCYMFASAQNVPTLQPHPQHKSITNSSTFNPYCHTASQESQNADPGTTNNCYGAINLDGTNTNPHPACYFHISTAISELSGWLAATKPSITVLLPFNDKSVVPITGWMYDPQARHNAIDYGTVNGTFPVNAVADGRVIWIGFMPSPGNVVIIEHASRTVGGQTFRTIYHHLRNGRDNDIAFARATMKSSDLYGYKWKQVKDSNGNFYINDYQKLADSHGQILAGNPTPQQIAEIETRWGTNDQKLLVKVGDTVKAGQQIGWAGTTGFDSGGVHLHIMFARPAMHMNGSAKESRWTFFDPYGIYAVPPSCYRVKNPSGDGPNQHPAYFNFKYQLPGGLTPVK